MPQGKEEQTTQLVEILRSIVHDQLVHIDNLALMFSGGLDSATLAVIARKKCNLTLYTAGFEGSHDLEWVRECASIIDLPIVEIILDKEDIVKSIESVVKTHDMTNPKWMSTFVGFDIVLSKIKEKQVMCGQGADELFGGYKKYNELEDPDSRMAIDIKELVELEMPEYMRMAGNYDKILLAPFLDERLRAFAANLPLEMKINDSGNKFILREAAKMLGVPGMMADKPKKAMQYGSGISKAIKHYLKNSEIDLQTLIESYKI
ncbi:MAG: asparagine synthase C-terminal domain-containing protein [Thermoplasmata archaeon]|nr:asparagine synthase C-terminal domain-containing protein [Thermoplasmata archaeon]